MDESIIAQEERIALAIAETELGSDEYKRLLDDLEQIRKIKQSGIESDKKLEFEAMRLENEKAESEIRIKLEKRSIRARIGIGILSFLGTLGLGLMTVKDEETRAITSRATQIAKDTLHIKY